MTFLTSDTGAVTVDWVVLTAGLVGLGLATMSVVSSGVEDLTQDTGQTLNRSIVASSLNWGNTVFETFADLDLAHYTEAEAMAYYAQYASASDFDVALQAGAVRALADQQGTGIYSDQAQLREIMAFDRGLTGADPRDHASDVHDWTVIAGALRYGGRVDAPDDAGAWVDHVAEVYGDVAADRNLNWDTVGTVISTIPDSSYNSWKERFDIEKTSGNFSAEYVTNMQAVLDAEALNR